MGDGGLFQRLRRGLQKTRDQLGLRVREALSGRATIDDALYEELEAVMIEADLGVRTTQRLLDGVSARVRRERVESSEHVRAMFRDEIRGLLTASGVAAAPVTPAEGPFVSLIVGVNGVGKTTTIGKLARLHASAGRRVVVCAADTFRAGAIEQLGVWAERAGARMVKHQEGADPAAVVFDALEAAVAGKYDVVLIDTAGRLHNKDNLMLELEKVRRVVSNRVPEAPHETLLILDATTGQNAVSQAREFGARIGLTGLVVTKLDGSAKGGVVASIVSELSIPVLYLGTGEGLDDLVGFEAEAFADALFA